MKPSLLCTLERQRSEIRSHWATLLRRKKAPTPLADPDILTHLFDGTLDEVLSLSATLWRLPPPPIPRCACNPFRHYFSTLEQVLLETLAWAQVEDPTLTAEERVASVYNLSASLRRVARREIQLFDGLCRKFSPTPPPLDFRQGNPPPSPLLSAR